MNIPKVLTKIFFYLSVLLTFCTAQLFADEKETITFKAEDGLEITADLYIAHKLSQPFIILFHQAGWSRGEYLEIAPKLNKMGFNCMAVDQRSGGGVNDIENETYKRAVKEKKETDYLSAYVDLESAVKFAKANYAKEKILVWGSSYSAALVLKLAGEMPGLINGVLSFAPGEYFAGLGKSDTYISNAAINIKCPVFITSAKNEKENWKNIYDVIPGDNKFSFVPETKGNHGSRALWEKFDDSKDYWMEVSSFLKLFTNEDI